MPRGVIPLDDGEKDIWLVCFADAAVAPGGVVVFAGVEISPGVLLIVRDCSQVQTNEGDNPS